MSVNTRFQIPSKKKITRWKIGRARGPRHVSETGNEVPGKHVSNNGHWLVCSVRCGTILLKPHIGTVYSSSAPFWVLPIQKMSGSRGSPCTKVRSRNRCCSGKAISLTSLCSLSYPGCKAHSLYYIANCGLSGFTTFFHICPQTARFSGKESWT